MNRLKTILIAATVTAMTATAATDNDASVAGNYQNNRHPLLQKDYIQLPLGSIHAEGWIEEQLVRMRDGMTGHLDEIYAKVVGPRNGWLGGDGDMWERGPYWIDGLLPLAYLLNDQTLIEKTRPWIEWALASQKPDGYFGPDTDLEYEPGLQRDNSHDWWPRMVMLKIMQQYYTATHDSRVIDFMTRYFRYQLAKLPEYPLGNWTSWAEFRGGDNLMSVYWLYNITGEKFLLDLGELIHKQTFNWTDVFMNQDHLTRPLSLHCVNLAQGFKEPIVYYQQSKDAKQLQATQKALHDIRTTIGLPTGLWGGDEMLRFGKPTTGSELCTAIEMMFTTETLLEVTGDMQWADYLERVAYNALPTQVTDDCSARQYYQQVNQISVTRHRREFSTPHEDTDLVFGELNGYPCCTSNLHQGWPKFVQNLWYATADGGIAALVYAPSNVTARVANGIETNIKEETAYPFDETVSFRVTFTDRKVKKAFFPFHLRIPSWCKQPVVRLNGEPLAVDAYPGTVARINREWKSGDVLSLELPMDVTVSRWYESSAVVERGPLVYALKMNERWEKKMFESDKAEVYGKWYYEVTSDSPWNYALLWRSFTKENIKEAFTVEKSDTVASYPWNVENAPIRIKTKAVRVDDWTEVRGSAGPVPYYTQIGGDFDGEDTIELIPYGCTTLRITEFPVR